MVDRISLMVGRLYTLDLRREEGQAVTEYGLVLAFVAVALVLVLATLHTAIGTLCRGAFAIVPL